MARVPMVTRTITRTEVTVMCLDVEKGESINKDVTLASTFKDDEKLLKEVKKIVETDTIKAVHIVDKIEVEALYGMAEQEFIERATVLPPRESKISRK
jgi:hypothetical protein